MFDSIKALFEKNAVTKTPEVMAVARAVREGKKPAKVAIFDVHDYPRDLYTAYSEYRVLGDQREGYQWGARILSYTPVSWSFNGQITAERPDAAEPIYPKPPDISQAAYSRMAPIGQARVREMWDDFRKRCAEIYEDHPKPMYVLEEAIDVVPNEGAARAILPDNLNMTCGNIMHDACDFAAQSWIKERIGRYRRAPNSQAGYSLTLGPGGMLWDIAQEIARRWLAPLLMALRYSTTIRDNRLTQVENAIDGGAGAGLWDIYDGTQPATCGTATTLLAQITLSDPAGTVATQVLTFDNTPALTDASANATGTATWFRVKDSTSVCCIDGTVGTSGSDLNLNSVGITTGQAVTITSATITAGNA